MKVFLTLVLIAACQCRLHGQPAQSPAVYTGAHARYQLLYPRTWRLLQPVGRAEATFAPGGPWRGAAPAVVALTAQPLPDDRKDRKPLTHGAQDSVWRSIQRLPQAQVLRLDQRDSGPYEEVDYDYTYAPGPAASAARTHVVGRRVWRGGYEYQVEYRAAAGQDARYLAEGQQLVASFAFTGVRVPSRRYGDQVCDNKLYGIAATRRHNGQWEDDCRTIHEFPANNLTAAPVVHPRVLPFQSYALAKGFDNCLYSVTKAPTDTAERVYRYDPATRQGRYTTWQLPAQGPDNSWISAATDERGHLYFLTSDAGQLVEVDPADGTVTVVWTTDPLRQTPFYPLIAFAGAGTHGNFCLDDANTLYLVYSTDGSLLKVNLLNHQPSPERMELTGLPARGGYSDLLMQNDAAGRRRMYLAGPHALYEVDLARRQARRVRQGTYTDLAGCNLFSVVPRPMPAPPPPTTATWRGRVLDAVTYMPLEKAVISISAAGAEAAVPLTSQGAFAVPVEPGRPYVYRARLAGYVATDSAWTAAPGPSVRDILLRPLAVGTTLRLDNVQFEQGQAVLLPASLPALDQLLDLLTDNPRLTIELRGHTDNVGPPEKNVVLSEQRVAAVKDYLVGHGIAEARVTGLGLGGAQPLASNDQEATRKLNRRVEFRVTGVQ